jgi:hypothetical protein
LGDEGQFVYDDFGAAAREALGAIVQGAGPIGRRKTLVLANASAKLSDGRPGSPRMVKVSIVGVSVII